MKKILALLVMSILTLVLPIFANDDTVFLSNSHRWVPLETSCYARKSLDLQTIRYNAELGTATFWCKYERVSNGNSMYIPVDLRHYSIDFNTKTVSIFGVSKYINGCPNPERTDFESPEGRVFNIFPDTVDNKVAAIIAKKFNRKPLYNDDNNQWNCVMKNSGFGNTYINMKNIYINKYQNIAIVFVREGEDDGQDRRTISIKCDFNNGTIGYKDGYDKGYSVMKEPDLVKHFCNTCV
jgi:hypothetical protein